MTFGSRYAPRVGLIIAFAVLSPGTVLADGVRIDPGDAPTAELTRTLRVSSYKDENVLYTSDNDRSYADAARTELQRRHVEQAAVVASQAKEGQETRKLSAVQDIYARVEKLKSKVKDPKAWGRAVHAQRDDFKNALEKEKQRFDTEIAQTRQQLQRYEDDPEFSRHLASVKREARLPDDHPRKGQIYTSPKVEEMQLARGHAQARLNQLQAEKGGYERAGEYIDTVERFENAVNRYGDLARKRDEYLDARQSGATAPGDSSTGDFQGSLEGFRELTNGYGRDVVNEVLDQARSLNDFVKQGVGDAVDESQKTFQKLLGQYRERPGESGKFGELKDGQLTGALSTFREQKELQSFLDGVGQTIDTASGGLERIDQVNGYIERVENFTEVMTDRTERERIGNLDYVNEDMKAGVQKFSDVNRALKALAGELPEGLPRETANLVTQVGDTLIESVNAGNELQRIRSQGGEDMFGDMKLVDKGFAEASGITVREIMDGDDAGRFVVKDVDGTEIVVTHDQLETAKDVMSAMTIANGRNLTQAEFVKVAAAVKYGGTVEVNLNSVAEGVVDLGTQDVSPRDLLDGAGRALLEENRLGLNGVEDFMRQAFDGTSILDQDKGRMAALWSKLSGGDEREFRDWQDLSPARKEDLINKMHALNAIVRESDRGELSPNQFGALVYGDIQAGGGLLNDIETARLKLGDASLDAEERRKLQSQLVADLHKLGIDYSPEPGHADSSETAAQGTGAVSDAEPATNQDSRSGAARELADHLVEQGATPEEAAAAREAFLSGNVATLKDLSDRLAARNGSASPTTVEPVDEETASRQRTAEELAGRLMAAGATAEQTRAALEAWLRGDMGTLQSISRQVMNPAPANPAATQATEPSPSVAEQQGAMSDQLAATLRAAGATPAQTQAALEALRNGDMAALQRINQQVLNPLEESRTAETEEPDEPVMSAKDERKMNKSIARMRRRGATEDEIQRAIAAYKSGDVGYARALEHQVSQRDLEQFLTNLNQVSDSFESTVQQLTRIKQERQARKQGQSVSAAGGSPSQPASGSRTTTSASAAGTARYSGSFSGSWGGSCSIYGSVSGSFSVSISRSGNVSGRFNGFESGSIGGSVSPSGQFRATGSASGGGMNCSWVGMVRRIGAGALNGSGQWSCGGGCGGSWSL